MISLQNFLFTNKKALFFPFFPYSFNCLKNVSEISFCFQNLTKDCS